MLLRYPQHTNNCKIVRSQSVNVNVDSVFFLLLFFVHFVFIVERIDDFRRACCGVLLLLFSLLHSSATNCADDDDDDDREWTWRSLFLFCFEFLFDVLHLKLKCIYISDFVPLFSGALYDRQLRDSQFTWWEWVVI